MSLPQDHLVFSPGEKLELDVLLNSADITPGATYLLAAALLTGRSDEQLWNEDRELKPAADEASTAPISQFRCRWRKASTMSGWPCIPSDSPPRWFAASRC